MIYLSYALTALHATLCLAPSSASSFPTAEIPDLPHLAARNRTLLSIPTLFQYRNVPYKVIYIYGRASHNNPGVSTRNWRAAVNAATQNVQALKVMVQADPEDPLPDSRFEFATTLARPAPGHALQPEKMLKFEFVGTDNEALTYEEVEIALLGLMKYTTVWDSGSKNDQVRMCTFRLFYEDNNWPFAEGSVRLTADSLAQAMNTS